ncbi:MAG: hypothetical protein GY821_07205 [Gammaproteobacteria bacterium]|nr:hypothetical protein [Gammaproteobacteria bacterium]
MKFCDELLFHDFLTKHYLQTMERKGYSTGIAIQMALTGELYQQGV